MAVLEATFKATLDELKVPDEIQTALKDDGLLDKKSLLERCANEAVLGKWLVVRVVKTNKISDLSEDNWEFSVAWSSLRSSFNQLKGSNVPEPENKPPTKGAKVDGAKRSKLVTEFEKEYPIPFGSKRTAPGNRLLEKCLDMGPGGKDAPLAYVSPASCNSVLDDESEDKAKAAKLEKASVCCCHLVCFRFEAFVCPRIKKRRKLQLSLGRWGWLWSAQRQKRRNAETLLGGLLASRQSSRSGTRP